MMKTMGLADFTALSGDLKKPAGRAKDEPNPSAFGFKDALRTASREARADARHGEGADRIVQFRPSPTAGLGGFPAVEVHRETILDPGGKPGPAEAIAETGGQAAQSTPAIETADIAPTTLCVESAADGEEFGPQPKKVDGSMNASEPAIAGSAIARQLHAALSAIAASPAGDPVAPAETEAGSADELLPATGEQPSEDMAEQMAVAALLSVTAPAPVAPRADAGKDDAEAGQDAEAKQASDIPAARKPAAIAQAAPVEAEAKPQPRSDGDGGSNSPDRKADKAEPAESVAKTDQGAAQPRVAVIERPAAIAPLPQLSPPALAVVTGVASNTGWAAYVRPSAGVDAAASGRAGAVNDLKIQLNPIELGMVTAKLRLEDGQLKVEIEVESADALQRLQADRDTIERALRAVGMDVGEVRIQQAQSSSQGGSAGQNTGGGPRDGQQFFAQNQGAGQSGGEAGSGDGSRSRGDGQGENNGRNSGSAEGDASRRGVYI